METSTTTTYSAFRGHDLVASGHLKGVATAIRALLEQGDPTLVLIFDDLNGRQIDIDLAGSADGVARRYGGDPQDEATGPPPRRRPGRPKLGVVGREVTLLPRHWAWLQSQRGGPSATLRRLVDEARTEGADQDRMRQAQDAINRFISATAGNLAGFEEANRALYREDRQRFDIECSRWPLDIRRYVEHWTVDAFGIMQASSLE